VITYDISISFHARRERVIELNEAAAETNSPANVRIALIPGGNIAKFIPHPFSPAPTTSGEPLQVPGQ
jgi:hypothetical protein